MSTPQVTNSLHAIAAALAHALNGAFGEPLWTIDTRDAAEIWVRFRQGTTWPSFPLADGQSDVHVSVYIKNGTVRGALHLPFCDGMKGSRPFALPRSGAKDNYARKMQLVRKEIEQRIANVTEAKRQHDAATAGRRELEGTIADALNGLGKTAWAGSRGVSVNGVVYDLQPAGDGTVQLRALRPDAVLTIHPDKLFEAVDAIDTFFEEFIRTYGKRS